MITFSQRLKFLRKEEKLTQQDLADIINVKRATIAKWESKNAIPDIDTLQKISIYFKTSIDYLTGKSNKRQYEEETIMESEPSFILTIQNFLHFQEIAHNEGLSQNKINKLIQAFQLPEFEENLLFDFLNQYSINNNSPTNLTKEEYGNKTETNDTK